VLERLLDTKNRTLSMVFKINYEGKIYIGVKLIAKLYVSNHVFPIKEIGFWTLSIVRILTD
jgi:hypothetical protein